MSEQTDDQRAGWTEGDTSVCQHEGCGLPIRLVASHSTEDCSIEGTTWWHDAEEVPDGVDPCAAYDANDDHEGVPTCTWCDSATPSLRASSGRADAVLACVAHSTRADGTGVVPTENHRTAPTAGHTNGLSDSPAASVARSIAPERA